MITTTHETRLADRVVQLLDTPLPTPVERRVRPVARWAAGRALRTAGWLQGLAYHLEGRHPDPDVDDKRLAQRVRSTLGPLEKRLDVPRVRVTVRSSVAELDGAVDTADQARELERATGRVAGVVDVRSRLRVGLRPGETRPSEGRAAPAPSRAWTELVGAARGTGLSDDGAERAVRAVLATLMQCLPTDEAAHVLSHLPQDVRDRATPPVEVGTPRRPRSVGGFDRSVSDRARLATTDASLATRAVLATLRDLVPEEVADVEAVLPAGLKPLWHAPAEVDTTS